MDDGHRRGEGLQLGILQLRDLVVPQRWNNTGLLEEPRRLPHDDRQGGRGSDWYGGIFTSERHKREASQWMAFGLLLLPGKFSSQKPLEALEAYHHRLLRSLSSNMRSELM